MPTEVTTEYVPVDCLDVYACVGADCHKHAIVGSAELPDFKWCVRHFAETVEAQTAHQMARRDSREEIDLLVSALHGTYHRIEEGRYKEAAETIERVAIRFPECSAMPRPL